MLLPPAAKRQSNRRARAAAPPGGFQGAKSKGRAILGRQDGGNEPASTGSVFRCRGASIRINASVIRNGRPLRTEAGSSGRPEVHQIRHEKRAGEAGGKARGEGWPRSRPRAGGRNGGQRARFWALNGSEPVSGVDRRCAGFLHGLRKAPCLASRVILLPDRMRQRAVTFCGKCRA